MLKSSRAFGERAVELIRDIGRSKGQCTAKSDPEENLLRVAGDPLLLREFLLRPPPGDQERAAAPVSSESTIALASSSALNGKLEMNGQARSPGRYHLPDPAFEPSLFPSVFKPSSMDRNVAIDEWGAEQVDPASCPVPLIAVLAAVAIPVIFLLLLIPD